MNYLIYKLHFSTPVHFGKNALSNSEYSVCSDTIFSALCSEAVKSDNDLLNELVSKSRDGHIMISDALPYVDKNYLLPKPYTFIERKQETDSSVVRKAYKNLKYISTDDFDSYMNGDFDVLAAQSISGLGVSALKVSASIRNDDGETKPYEVGTFAFNDNCGLYIILGYEDDCDLLIDSLMQQLCISGIGGKRSSGYGKFVYEKVMPNEWLIDRLTVRGTTNMLLNTALPKEEELQAALAESRYSLIKRSGFVASTSYSDSWQRKKDVVMFKAGSCFEYSFEGDIYDVSTTAGSHPVYRLGKPMFMRVNI